MKTAILYFILLLLSFSTAAQINKGQWILGGDLEFSSQSREGSNIASSEENKVSSFEFSPSAGYFISDNLAIGLRFIVGTGKTKNRYENMSLTGYLSIQETTSKSTPIGISPFIRYYFLPAARKINIFADASYAYTSTKQETEIFNFFGLPGDMSGVNIMTSKFSEKLKGHNFSIAAGPAIFINKNVSLELAIGYTLSNLDGNFDNTKVNRVYLGTGFNVHL